MILVKVKTPVEQPNGELKRQSSAVLVRNAINLTDLDVKVTEFFEKRPENQRTFSWTGISRISFNDVLIDAENPDSPYWKIKVSLSQSADEGKPTKNTALVQSETLEKAYERLKASFKNTTFDVEFHSGTPMVLLGVSEEPESAPADEEADGVAPEFKF